MAIMIQGLILIVTLVCLWLMFRPNMYVKEKREIGVARASAIYKDEKGVKMLVAPKLDLQGKPDFIFETWLLKRYIPLEIKSGRLNEEEPHLGDLYQLGAYFLLVEEAYGKRPPYGKLVYANKTFTVRNTRRIRREVKQAMGQMRQMLEGSYDPGTEVSYMKCKNCVCKDTVCEYYEGE